MTDQDDSDDAARRRTAGSEERATIPGFPARHLPPRPVPKDPEITPPHTPLARQRALQGQRAVQPPAPPIRSMSPAPVSPRTTVTVTTDPPASNAPPEGAKVSVELAGTRVDFRTKSPGAIGRALWALAVGGLGLGGGAAGAALTHHATPPPAPAFDPTTDPCPPSQPLTARSPLCLRLQAAEGAVNSMAWDVEDLKKKLAREHDARVDLEGAVSDLRKATPHIEGVPKK